MLAALTQTTQPLHVTLIELGLAGLVAYWLFALATVPSVLLNREGHPVSALAWLLAVFALPPLGLLAWWGVGRTHLHRRRRKRRKAHEAVARALAQAVRGAARGGPTSVLKADKLPGEFLDSVFPPSSGNRVTLLAGARQAYDAWETALLAATHHVHFLFYSWADDETGRRFRDLLCAASERGVEVRALYDAVGSPKLSAEFLAPLVSASVKVHPFLPTSIFTARPAVNFRNHRKILVVDGVVGFVGGINVGDEYLDWDDLAIEIRGPEVDRLQEVFVEDWYFTAKEALTNPEYYGRWSYHNDPADACSTDSAGVTCATIASGPEQELNATREMLFLALTRARSRIWILTPYFVPEPAIEAALRSAVYRGVDVEVLVPEKNDVALVRRASRSFYPRLLHGGIRILEYLPSMMHAKAVILDDDLLFIGSANMDTRSFKLNFEASCFVECGKINQAAAGLFAACRTQSREVTLSDVTRTAYATRVLDSLAHLLSPLL